jgi:hypothetical protein
MMNEPPGTIPRIAPAHPRRPPAHKSVSLRHSPTACGPESRVAQQASTLSSPTLASDKANPPSSVSPQFLSNKHSSGESSDAGQWFEKTNNNASQSKGSFVDSECRLKYPTDRMPTDHRLVDEPPFFLRNSSSSETPPDDYHYPHAHPTIPYRPNLQLGTDGSSTEDFRGVIDDLTVANKKLKQKLKKYEKLYDAHLQEDKLFEVRFHGLPDHKKKELEETLRKFAAEFDDRPSIDYPQNSSYTPALKAQNTASSTSRFAESGYASMSASGQNTSAQGSQDKERRKLTRSAYNRQQQSIQSYLHNIPMGLLPNNKSISMSEKSKKKIVVRRLEQIFAGKRSTNGSHSQPMQQEEVAQSAATADREQREATGKHHKPEGQREAYIMPDDGNEDNDAGQAQVIQGLRPALHIEEQDFAGSGLSPDQRPTRPLDLDPYRAQVPTDNMDYIRHLGFTPPDIDSGEATLGHGWIYLNLIINMAQLHTLNVTPEFVKNALLEYSNHLEISCDGRKIRWKGGHDITKHSGESSSEHWSSASPNENGSVSPFQRMQTSTSGTSRELPGDYDRARKLARVQREREKNRFAYKPLFFHKEDSGDEEDYGFDAESSTNYPHQPQPAGNSSGFSSSIMHSSWPKPRRDDGPMIFYTKAKFCTDLSGDRNGAFLMKPGAYRAITSHPLGAASGPRSQQSVFDFAELRGPLDTTSMDANSMSGGRTVLSVDNLGFSPAPLENDSENITPELMQFEASGLGGVQPEDNFSIHVRRSQVPTAPSHVAGRRKPSLYPKAIENALGKQQSPKTSSQIHEKILSTSCKTLPNSTLPPASFLPFDSCSSGDVDSDLESDASSEPDESLSGGPATTMQITDTALILSDESQASEEEEEEESDYEDSDDGSVDLLATARQQDPMAVRESEREYDAALADRLAEEIPAGSSAATVGGGSGFNSPVEGVESKLEKRLSENSGSRASRAMLKRVRTSDSMTVQQPKTKSPKRK